MSRAGAVSIEDAQKCRTRTGQAMENRNAELHRDGLRRVLVESVAPQVDGGRYPAKAVIGDTIVVSCDLVADGHDVVTGALRYRRLGGAWQTRPLVASGNDRFAASFVVDALGTWELTVEGWIDDAATWRQGIVKKLAAGQEIDNELAAGAQLFREIASRAAGTDAAILARAAESAADPERSPAERVAAATQDEALDAARRHPNRAHATAFERVLRLTVDPERARFSTWYEMFPRSAGAPGAHGTLRDCAARLPYIQAMGFDVLYLPPIHPIGRAYRKGPNNTLEAKASDVGSPWAIGGPEGGHKAIHPQLGTLDDLRALVVEARKRGIEVALDIAFQASPDHPYVKEHPEWFRKRADGSIQYAENPPKKYLDVYPFDFEGAAWESLWRELLSVVLFWCDQGVRIFRVDNPHTKSLRFWEWCIAEVKAKHPEAIFLAEAFTRPKLMYALAKGGFTQSYTYFTWRHTAREFTEYLTELTRPPVKDFYRPNFWPNTPDILPEHLQFGGRPTFVQRLVLAATLSSNYGMYGPPFELMEHVARPGSEEYIDNEKFQLRTWDIEREDSLRDMITLVNRIRRENPALQANDIAFHACDNPQLLCFSKRSADKQDNVLVVVNMDAHHTHAGTLDLDLAALGLDEADTFQAHDLLADARYQWRGARNYVELNPHVMPASIFRIRRRIRTEHDFEYFL
jgi:starch synthase (maltosyl-transferring)